jgi:N-acetylmuramoyl-L-alanine amidase
MTYLRYNIRYNRIYFRKFPRLNRTLVTMKGKTLCVVSLAVICVFTASAFSRADTAGTLLNTAQEKYEALLKSEKRRSSKSMWLEVINAFDRVVKGYPGSDEAPLALFAEGCIWREMFNYSITLGELYRAEATFNRFVKTYPNHRLVADAKKNIEEIQDQKKNNSLIAVSTAKPNPEEFPGRTIALKDDGKYVAHPAPKTDSGKTTKVQKKDTAATGTGLVASSASIKKIRYFTDDTRTRIVVDLDAAVSFDDAALPPDASTRMPPRIYVDLVGASLSSGLYGPLAVKDGLISQIRWSKKEGSVRVVLDLEKKADYVVFRLSNPNRLVIDVSRK